MNLNKKFDKLKAKTKEFDIPVKTAVNSINLENDNNNNKKSTIADQSATTTTTATIDYLVQIVKDVKKYEDASLTNNEPNPIIQHMENDIKALENTAHIKKMHPKKLKFHKRNFKLDVKNQRLIASTGKCFKRERVYDLDDLNEVNNGAGSVNLQAFKNKNLNKKEEIDNLAFEVIYDNHKKSLNLMAANQLEKNRWINVLSYLIESKNKKSIVDWTTDEELLKTQFLKADKGNDKTIDLDEVDAFLESLNLKLKKEQIATLIKKADKNKDGLLAEEEFKQFVMILFHRKEMLSLFNLIASDKGSKSIPTHLALNKFKYFLKSYQKEIKTDEECLEIFKKYETDEKNFKSNQLSFQGFVNYLNDESQHICDPHTNQVTQNMDLPIFSYYVNSSHNTYLTGDQLTSMSSADCYRAAIMNGARLVEMDVYDGADNEPRIYHQKTLTSKMKFSDALLVIKEYAFKLSDYPLIITIELHCSAEQQKVMAQLIKKYIGEYLYTTNFDEKQPYPSLNELKRKIIIRSQMPKVQKNELANVVERAVQDKFEPMKKFDEFVEMRESPIEAIEEYSNLINLMQNVAFKGVEFAFEFYNQNQTSSLSEKKCDDFIEKEDQQQIIDYTNNFLVKVYPGFFRTDSSNLNPLSYWNLGFQIAALNFQTSDNQMCLNKALFNDNGNCGFVLKPDILRNPMLNFNPDDLSTMTNKKSVEIKIISALNLPQNEEILLIKDISDPFVTVNMYGIKADQAEKKSKSVQDNGFNPIWNETFKFVVNCPELALIKFTVKDEDIGKNQLIGDYTIRFNNMRPGYRHIKLNNKISQGILFVGIKIKPYKEESQKRSIRTVKEVIDEAEDELTKLSLDDTNVDKNNKIVNDLSSNQISPLPFSNGDSNCSKASFTINNSNHNLNA